MAATVVVRRVTDGDLQRGGLDTLEAAYASGQTLWVDVDEADAEVLAVIGRVFNLHPLAIEDCLHFPQRPKIDLYPESVFLVWAFPRRDGTTFETLEMDVFLGERFLITSHRERIPALDAVAAEALLELQRGPAWTLHAILDRGVDELFPVVDEIADRLDAVEDALLGDPETQDLQSLYSIKRQLVTTYRVVTAERDALRSMARREQFVSADAYMYFQDVGDHLERVVDSIDTYRDVASGAMDIYLSAVNNRLNDVMKRLTVVATIFMPLTFITGIFGMNLTAGMWPPTAAEWAFGVVMVSMVAVALGMIVYFWRKRWL